MFVQRYLVFCNVLNVNMKTLFVQHSWNVFLNHLAGHSSNFLSVTACFREHLKATFHDICKIIKWEVPLKFSLTFT